MVTYRYLGYGTTNSNGIAKLDHDANGNALSNSYTGTGAGKVNIVASLDSTITGNSVISETYGLLDCIKYDKGLSGAGNHNDIWSISTTSSICTVTRTDEYTEFKETTIGNNFSNEVGGMTDSCIVEFDYWQLDGLNNTFMQLKNQAGTGQVYNGGMNLSQLNGSLENWYHIKITIQNGRATILNETNGASFYKDLNDVPRRFTFWSSGDVTTIRFKNFMIYPI